MKKIIYSTVVLMALLPLTGCSQNADGLAQQQVDQLNELADAMEAESEPAQIEAIQEKMKGTTEALEALGLSDEKKKELADKYGDEIAEAMKRIVQAEMAKMGGAMGEMMKGLGGNMPAMPEGIGAMPQMP